MDKQKKSHISKDMASSTICRMTGFEIQKRIIIILQNFQISILATSGRKEVKETFLLQRLEHTEWDENSTAFSVIWLMLQQFWDLNDKYLQKGTNLKTIERLRVTFMANSKRKFVPPDQFFPLLVIYCSLPLQKS